MDLRLYLEDHKVVWLCHGDCLTVTLEEFLQVILKFINHTEREVIFLDLHILYNFVSTDDRKMVMDLFKKVLGEDIICAPHEEATLKSVTKKGGRIAISAPEEMREVDPLYGRNVEHVCPYKAKLLFLVLKGREFVAMTFILIIMFSFNFLGKLSAVRKMVLKI